MSAIGVGMSLAFAAGLPWGEYGEAPPPPEFPTQTTKNFSNIKCSCGHCFTAATDRIPPKCPECGVSWDFSNGGG